MSTEDIIRVVVAMAQAVKDQGLSTAEAQWCDHRENAVRIKVTR